MARTPGYEFVEIEVEENVNLSQGFIGDGDELHHLEKNENLLRLKPGERIRIFTLIDVADKEGFLKKQNEKVKSVAARCRNGSYPIRGIYHSNLGDRIVIVDGNHRVLLDVDYWPIVDPKEVQSARHTVKCM